LTKQKSLYRERKHLAILETSRTNARH